MNMPWFMWVVVFLIPSATFVFGLWLGVNMARKAYLKTLAIMDTSYSEPERIL